MVGSRVGSRERSGPVPASGRLPSPAFTYLALLLSLALVLAACSATDAADGSAMPASPTDGLLTVRAFEWGYEPKSIALRQGKRVQIVLENEGLTLHNLKIEDLAADDIESHSSGPLSGGEGSLFVGAEAGQQGTLTFVPQESGTFTLYCTIQGHRQLGMAGTLTVE